MASAGTVDPAAHQEYLLGQHYLWKLTEEDLSGDRAFRTGDTPRCGYAAAYAGLSHAWWWRGVWGAKTFKEIESPSRAAARKALALDPRLAEAHVSMGRLRFGHDWDWTGAEKDFRRALDIDPNNLDAHFFPRCCSWRWAASPSRSLTSREPSNSIRCRRRFTQRSVGCCIVPANSTRPFLI